MNDKIVIILGRDPHKDFESYNRQLYEGELGYFTDTKLLGVGDSDGKVFILGEVYDYSKFNDFPDNPKGKQLFRDLSTRQLYCFNGDKYIELSSSHYRVTV